MKKQEFIQRYGLEAYEKMLKQNKERSRKQYKEEPDKVREYKRKWAKENPDKIKEYQDRWAKENPDKKKEWGCRYRKENSDKERERHRKYREENVEKERNYRKANAETIKERSRRWRKENPEITRAYSLNDTYKRNDKEADRGECTLTAQWIVENIFTSKCIYCGDSEWRHLGCDRIDNSKPHTPDNVVCACGMCNIERGDRYSVEEFIQYRSLHPRSCDVIRETESLFNEKGALKKRIVSQ